MPTFNMEPIKGDVPVTTSDKSLLANLQSKQVQDIDEIPDSFENFREMWAHKLLKLSMGFMIYLNYVDLIPFRAHAKRSVFWSRPKTITNRTTCGRWWRNTNYLVVGSLTCATGSRDFKRAIPAANLAVWWHILGMVAVVCSQCYCSERNHMSQKPSRQEDTDSKRYPIFSNRPRDLNVRHLALFCPRVAKTRSQDTRHSVLVGTWFLVLWENQPASAA